jgi:hypothetical protein
MNSAARSAGAVVVTEDMIFGAVTLVILSPRPPSSRERQMATANEPHPAVDQIRLREDLADDGHQATQRPPRRSCSPCRSPTENRSRCATWRGAHSNRRTSNRDDISDGLIDVQVEALPAATFAFSIPLFVFLFAAMYVLMDGTTSNAFPKPDDPAGCLVFTGDGVDDRGVQRHCRTLGVGPALTTAQTVGDPLRRSFCRSASPSARPLRRAAHSGSDAGPPAASLWPRPPLIIRHVAR